MKGSTTVTTNETEIIVKVSYQVDRESFKKLTNEIKAVGNGHFDWDRKVWVFPKHPDVAVRLRETIEGWSGVIFDEAFLDLSCSSLALAPHEPADERPPPLAKMPSWRHQSRGYRMIERQLGTLLAHDMGTGKTKTTIDAICNLDLNRVLIVCPKSVLDVWPAEFNKHAVELVKVIVLEGTIHHRAEHLERYYEASDEQIIIVTNYAAFVNSEFEKACKRPWDLIVLDECLHPDTLIDTPRGNRRIEDLDVGDIVYGFDHATDIVVPAFLKKTFKSASGTPLINVHGVRMTENHAVWTATGYRAAGTLPKNGLCVRLERGHLKTSYEECVVRRESECFNDFVYDIETSTGNYFANRLLVHNSHKIKSVRGKTSMALWRLARYAKRRLCLTGTPMPHSPLDIFAQYRFLDESVFGRYVGRFKAEYAITGGFEGKQILGWRNLAKMNRLIYSIGDRVMKRDVLDLPPVIHEQRLVELGPEARRIYRDLETELIAEVKDGIITAANGLVKLLRLQQATSGFACVETNTWDEKRIVNVDNAKRNELAEIMEGIDKDEPIVVVCNYRNDLDTVHSVSKAAERTSYELSGRKRCKGGARKELSDWQESCRGDVLAVQIQAGGLGVDLTRAQYAVYYSIGFHSPGDIEQSLARLDRPGQTRSVTYLHIIAKGTIDVAVYAALRAKAKVVESVLGTLGEK